MRTTLIMITLALLAFPLHADAQKHRGFSGVWRGQGQEIYARVTFNPRSRTLAIKERCELFSTKSSRRTRTLEAQLGSRKKHSMFHKIYYVGARPVEKVKRGIYFFRDRSGRLENSMRKPEGTKYHRIHVPGNIQVTDWMIRSIAEQAMRIEKGRYNSVSVPLKSR